MSLEPRKKLLLIILILLIGGGIFFALWQIFLNHATITFTAKAPYSVTLWKSKGSSAESDIQQSAAQRPDHSSNCNNDRCTLDVTPGSYNVVIAKKNYQTEHRLITLGPLGRYEEKIQFLFLPTVSALGPRKIFQLPPAGQAFNKNLLAISLQTQLPTLELKNLPAKITDLIFGPHGASAFVFEPDKISHYQMNQAILTSLDLPPQTQIFYGPNDQVFYYIDRNKENLRQTLYRREFDDQGQLKNPVMLTSFTRDLQNYSLKISPKDNKIILIDRTTNNKASTLYLIDLTAKTRLNLFSAVYIADAKWFPDDNDFLFEARETDNNPQTSIYRYQASNGNIKELELAGPLTTISPIDQNHLIAVKIQNVPSSTKIDNLEGKIIDTTTNADLKPGNDQTAVLAFIDYTFLKDQARIIKILPNETLPEAVELSVDQKSLYFLQKDQLFVLHFSDEGDGS